MYIYAAPVYTLCRHCGFRRLMASCQNVSAFVRLCARNVRKLYNFSAIMMEYFGQIHRLLSQGDEQVAARTHTHPRSPLDGCVLLWGWTWRFQTTANLHTKAHAARYSRTRTATTLAVNRRLNGNGRHRSEPTTDRPAAAAPVAVPESFPSSFCSQKTNTNTLMEKTVLKVLDIGIFLLKSRPRTKNIKYTINEKNNINKIKNNDIGFFENKRSWFIIN